MSSSSAIFLPKFFNQCLDLFKMKDQFENFTLDQADDKSSMRPPLAERMRPSNLDQWLGRSIYLARIACFPN